MCLEGNLSPIRLSGVGIDLCQISMTLRYVHPTPEHKQEAVKKLEQFNVEQVFALYERQQCVKPATEADAVESLAYTKIFPLCSLTVGTFVGTPCTF